MLEENDMTNLLRIGGKAPDFTLEDQDGKKHKLSDYKGKKVLLSFHPLAFTGVCALQMKSLEKNFAKFKKLNAVAFGVNIDHVPAKKAWANMLRIKKTRLLSDFWPHGDVAGKFAIFREKDGFSERANLIIDEKGILVYVRIYPIKELPDIDEVLEAIAHQPCECCSK